MTLVAVTQRVVVERGERRDSLDQRWYSFLEKCGLVPLLLPNHLETAKRILGLSAVKGFILTGGNDVASVGGDVPERDELENYLIGLATKNKNPVLGVCRGMQAIQSFFGIKLHKITGHVQTSMKIEARGNPRTVNSYHQWGTTESRSPLGTWAVAADGVVKAIEHTTLPMVGIMWHPERNSNTDIQDIGLFQNLMNSSERTKVA